MFRLEQIEAFIYVCASRSTEIEHLLLHDTSIIVIFPANSDYECPRFHMRREQYSGHDLS